MNRSGQLMNAAEIAALFGVSVPAVIRGSRTAFPWSRACCAAKAYFMMRAFLTGRSALS